jgi:hypothetical protein
VPGAVDESGTKKRGGCALKPGAGPGAVEAGSGRTTWFCVRGNSSRVDVGSCSCNGGDTRGKTERAGELVVLANVLFPDSAGGRRRTSE